MVDDNRGKPGRDSVIRFPRRREEPEPTPTSAVSRPGDIEVQRTRWLQQLYGEQIDHNATEWEANKALIEPVLNALAKLERTVLGDIGPVAKWPTADHDRVLHMLRLLAVLRDALDICELETLDIARAAELPWEPINSVYAPQHAAAAKKRYQELAIRVQGRTIFGYPPENDQPSP